VSKLKQLLANPQAAAGIAARGQARTLGEHSYSQRMALLVDLLERRRPKAGTPLNRTPRRQEVLVACPANLYSRIPKALKQALQGQHDHHRFILLSDGDSHDPGCQGQPRWCSHLLNGNPELAQCCLDATEPTQLLIVEERNNASQGPAWIAQLKQEAEERQIVCNSISPSS
jgi:hypothetical protein